MDLCLRSASFGRSVAGGTSDVVSFKSDSTGIAKVGFAMIASKASSRGVGDEGTTWVEVDGREERESSASDNNRFYIR